MKHLETLRLIARTQRRRAEAAEARVAELEPIADQMEILKAQCREVQDENNGLLQTNRDCVAWFEALNSDHQKALKALDELARLGNGKNYGNSIGNRIAQDALASMID